jgi:hypothetical protein
MDGLGILPRGSTMPAHDHVRFFVYWKQREHRTDYDLSVSLLDERFELAGQVSWTNLEDGGAVHSGDLTEAPAGASEFIDIDLASLSARYVRARASIAPRRRSSATCSARRARRGGRSSRAPCAPSPTSTGRAAPRCRCCSRVTTPGPGPARLEPGEPVTFLGLDYPDDLPPGSTAYAPMNLTELLSSA